MQTKILSQSNKKNVKQTLEKWMLLLFVSNLKSAKNVENNCKNAIIIQTIEHKGFGWNWWMNCLCMKMINIEFFGRSECFKILQVFRKLRKIPLCSWNAMKKKLISEKLWVISNFIFVARFRSMRCVIRILSIKIFIFAFSFMIS